MDKDNIIKVWWFFLSLISIINVFIIVYYLLNINENNIHWYLGILALIYTVVCGIRSIWLRKDIARICFIDSKISTPLVGRTLATIAEIAYIVIIIVILNNIGQDINKITKLNSNIFLITKLMLPIIIIAEVFSWLGCITTYELWNAIEESLWCLSGIIVFTVSCILYYVLLSLEKNSKLSSISNFLFLMIISSFIYIIFMIFNDIPMYIKRWKGKYDKKYDRMSYTSLVKNFKEVNNVSFIQNLREMNKCEKISKSFNDWKNDIPWFTGYFTLGVWSSIGMVKWFKNYSNM